MRGQAQGAFGLGLKDEVDFYKANSIMSKEETVEAGDRCPARGGPESWAKTRVGQGWRLLWKGGGGLSPEGPASRAFGFLILFPQPLPSTLI